MMKHPMNFGEFIWWIGCWFYMGCWVEILSSRNWWSTAGPTMSEGAPFRLNKYMLSNMFEVIRGYLFYTDKVC